MSQAFERTKELFDKNIQEIIFDGFQTMLKKHIYKILPETELQYKMLKSLVIELHNG